jgi:hypothetical protein
MGTKERQSRSKASKMQNVGIFPINFDTSIIHVGKYEDALIAAVCLSVLRRQIIIVNVIIN